MQKFRVILGVLLWVGIGAALWWSLDALVARRSSVGNETIPKLWSYAVGSRTHVNLDLDDSAWFVVTERMPIFLLTDRKDIRQIGHVTNVETLNDGTVNAAFAKNARAILYPDTPDLPAGSKLTFYETPQSAGWIIKAMTGSEKWQAVLDTIRATIQENQAEILAALRPVVEQSLIESFAVVKQDLPKALARQRKALEALGEKYEREIVKKRLAPLVKSEIWPQVQDRAIPLAKQIGEEMWGRVSVWKFGLKAIVDKLPFTKGDSVKTEFNRFLKRDAIPILNSHSDDMMRMVGEVIVEASKNEKVRQVLRDSMTQITNDPELHRIVFALAKELIIENPRLREVMQKHWTSDRAKAAFNLAGKRLEPLAMHISDTLFGTRADGISPEFARVLRVRLLKKDMRWMVLELPASATDNMLDKGEPITLPVKLGSNPMIHPFVPEIGGVVDVAER